MESYKVWHTASVFLRPCANSAQKKSGMGVNGWIWRGGC
jgi:hypothetical protein